MSPDVKAFWEAKQNAIKKEIQETGKYPKTFQYLPSDCVFDTDNANILKIDNDPTIVKAGALFIKDNLLGINKKSKAFVKTLEWGSIYIIMAKGTCLYKIGITDNIKRRFKDLSSASPLPLTIIKYAQCDHPHLLENKLHEMFAHKLVKNEWFQLHENDLFECFRFIDQYYNL